MILMEASDTIAAISTPLGMGGIGIVRLSGEDSVKILKKIFKPKKDIKIEEIKSHQLVYGHIYDPQKKELIDEVLISIMKAPATYTREDMVEINCHSGIVVLKKILEIVLQMKARLAEPGEFTRRAFLNGRIDLSQAEAVADIVGAKTSTSLKIAMQQLEGNLSQRIKNLSNDLVEIISHLEAEVDFSEEEGLSTMPRSETEIKSKEILKEIGGLIQSADEGRIFREGIKVVIAGKPNVGKSSLLNALLKEDRVIVTPVPGTTRDVVEVGANIKGIPLLISDTAGIYETEDKVEKIGVSLARKELIRSDIILLVFDANNPLGKEDIDLVEEVKSKKILPIVNKVDLPQRINLDRLTKCLGMEKKIVKISALHEIGMEELAQELVEKVFSKGEPVIDEIIVNNIRHKDALIRTKKSLQKGLSGLRKGLSEEFIAIDFRDSLSCLGEIVSGTTTEDILERIFSNFCIGK